ncbi:hypothetical protein L226DRAFT_218306 [Lentinus tigrinus ALCF2SS1-7]|nr:hypothetical protein L226DRAFT_218306 [Lentinus tigrinus ALCF2SS1-7]
MRFFSTTLTHLWLTLVNPTYDFPVYVGYFAKHAPNLQVLVLDCNPQAQPLMKCVSFSQFGLLELVHLRELRIPDIETSTSAIAELGALPRLQGLSLSVETSFRKPRGHLPVFRALKQLHLNTCHFAVAATVLEAVFAPYLEVFRVNCALPVVRHYEESSRVSDEDLQQVFTAVAEHPSYDTLRQLSFFISPLQLPRNMSDFIPPLLKLPALTKLEIIGFTAITVDDATLDAMSRAWPNLECLNLCQAVLYQYKTVVRDGREVRVADEEEGPDVQVRSLWVEPKATLHGLVPLALRCPRLHTINLAIDSSKGTPDAQVTHSSVPPSSAMLRLGRDMDPDRVFHRSPSPEPRLPYVLPENSALTRLYVGMFSGPPRNPEKAATLLSAIFPHLHDVSRSFEEEGDWPEIVQGWVHFDVLLRHFHVIRFQEQTWRRKLAVASTSASPT